MVKEAACEMRMEDKTKLEDALHSSSSCGSSSSDFEGYDSLDSLCSLDLDEDSLLLLDDVEATEGNESSSSPNGNKAKKCDKAKVKVKHENTDHTPQLIFSNGNGNGSGNPTKAGLKRSRSDATYDRVTKKKKKLNLKLKGKKARSKSKLKPKTKTKAKAKSKEDKVPYIPWSEVEDQKLKNIVQRKIEELRTVLIPEPDNTNTFPWGAISMRMKGRTPKQCRERWRNKLNPTIKQTPWTVPEDITLMDMHSKLGNRWVLLASLLPGRTENSVKTRFKSIVRAKRRSWRREEDEKVMELFNKLGGKWTEIATSLPNRTANGVKVRLKHLTSGKKEEKPEAGSPFQSFGVQMPEIIRKNEAFLKEYIARENAMNGRRSPKTRAQFGDVFAAAEGFMKDYSKPRSPVHVSYDPVLDRIHPRDNKSKLLQQEKSPKRSKGTRALIMDKLQSNEDLGINFASTIATILKPSEKCNAEAPYFSFDRIKPESQGFEPIGA